MQKVRIGQDHLFQVRPAQPLAVGATCSLTVAWPAGSQTYTLARRRDDTITALSTDRRRLTLTWSDDGAPADLLAGNPMPAHVSRDSLAQIPVRVVRLVSLGTGNGVVELADALPQAVNPVGGYLEYLTVSCTIPDEDVPTSPVRPVAWRMTYTPWVGGASTPQRVETGVLAVVRDRFETGLTDAAALTHAPWLRSALTAATPTLAPWIESAEGTLVSAIRAHQAMPADTWEDALSGRQFLRAHCLAVEVAVCDDLIARGVDRTARREQAAADMVAELDRVFSRLEWVDADGDGVVDAGEGGAAAFTPTASSGTSNAALVTFDDPTEAVELSRYQVGGDR